MSDKSREKKSASHDDAAEQGDEELLRHPVMAFPPFTAVMVTAQRLPLHTEPDAESKVLGEVRLKEVVPVLEAQGPWLMTVCKFQEAWFEAEYVERVEQDAPAVVMKDQEVVSQAFEEHQDSAEAGRRVPTETSAYMDQAPGYGMQVRPGTPEEMFAQAYAELAFAFEPNIDLIGSYRNIMQVFSPDSVVELEDYIALPAQVEVGGKGGEGPKAEREKPDKRSGHGLRPTSPMMAMALHGMDEELEAMERYLGTLREVAPQVASMAQASWGEDVGAAQVVEDASIKQQDKRGAVADAETIRVAPGQVGDVELMLEEAAHLVQHGNALAGQVSAEAPQEVTGLEAEAADAVEAAKAGKRFAIEGVAQTELYDDGAAAEVELTADEQSTPPRPDWLRDDESWRQLVTALETSPERVIEILMAEVPMLREASSDAIDFSVVAGLEGNGQTVFTTETAEWLRTEFERFASEVRAVSPAIDELVLLRDFVEHVRTVGVPSELQRVLVLLPASAVNLENLDSLVATMRHELTHAHQLLSDFLRVFPFGVDADNNWLPGVDWGAVMGAESETLAAEHAAMEVTAYSESVLITNLLRLDVAETRSWDTAVQRALLILEHWAEAPPAFRAETGRQSQVGTTVSFYLEYFFTLFATDVARLRTAVFGDVAQVPTAKPGAEHLPQKSGLDALEAHANDIRRIEHRLVLEDLENELSKAVAELPELEQAFVATLQAEHGFEQAREDALALIGHLEYARTAGLGREEHRRVQEAEKERRLEDPELFETFTVPGFGHDDAEVWDPGPGVTGYDDGVRKLASKALEQIEHVQRIVIVGFSDDSGAESARRKTAMDRALAVKALMIADGRGALESKIEIEVDIQSAIEDPGVERALEDRVPTRGVRAG